MKKKNIIIIILICIVLAGLGAGGFFLIQKQSNQKIYAEKVTEGRKYLSQMKYEEAEAAFEFALDKNPKDEEAYIGLYRVLSAQGKYRQAVHILELGYERTKSERLLELLNNYQEKNQELSLDEEGNVKNLYIDEEGNESIGDYDVVPILDAFVEEHPDFSLRGAKGLLALTGYEGALGYRTNDVENPSLEQDKETARAVAARLKETGWQFACHGYGHKHTAQISYDTLAADTSRWREEVGSLVGDTDVYIYPYGEEIEYPSDKLSLLQSQGFRYFCGVWSTQAFVSVKDTYVRQTRCNLDGFTMKTRPEAVADLIDVSKVLDPSRPELK